MSLKASLGTLAAFVDASLRLNSVAYRDELEERQARRLARFLNGPASKVPAFTGYRGLPLQDWPTMDKAQLMADFALYNRLGMTTAEAWAHFENGAAPEGYAVGASTGTSGNRGLYVVSEAERYRWLGVMLSRALPDVLTRRHRVAVVLPANSRLYDAANESRHLALQFFDLAQGIEAQFAPLEDFRPTVIVAPPKFLRALAESDTNISPARIFSGAEVLDDEDRLIIQSRFGVIVREIYMATEGLFAVGCEKGSLHLIEDHVHFEFEPVEGSDTLVSPLITDFSRTTQIMVRFRMNDVLELAKRPCNCGRPHRVIKAVHGRCDDVFQLMSGDGKKVRITPDVIRNAILGTDRSVRDFRVVQTGRNAVELTLPTANAPRVTAACEALQVLFASCGAVPEVTAQAAALMPPSGHKLRRVSVAPEALT